MATAFKVLGQVAPSATTATTLYTVPAAPTQTVVSTITVCNRSSVTVTYRIAVRPAGAVLADKHYITYDTPLSGNSTDTVTIGMTLDSTDVITVYASTGNLSFSLFGSEMT